MQRKKNIYIDNRDTPVNHTKIKPRNLFKSVNELTNIGNNPNRGDENKQDEQRKQRGNYIQLNDMSTPTMQTQIKPKILFKNIDEPEIIEVEGINLVSIAEYPYDKCCKSPNCARRFC